MSNIIPPTKVIFLDIDGVLNNDDTTHVNWRNSSYPLDKNLCLIYADILRKTEAASVLSSSWRLYPDCVEYLKMFFSKHEELRNIDITLKTPQISESQPRAFEIDSWLSKNPQVTRFAIIDDDPSAGLLMVQGNSFGLRDEYFAVDPNVGLTQEIANEVVAFLKD
jgi:hypothetical protein